jgi:hypothetical protein
MAYLSGGVISATDFNTLADATNTIMGVGTGQSGYGQTVTALANLTTSTTVTAAQWSGFLTILNNGLQHQSGVGASLGSINYTAGSIVTYFANVNTATTTISTNKASAAATGTVTAGSSLPTTLSQTSVANTTAQTQSWTRTITFPNGDAARYFFNAGGYINWAITATNTGATLRGADLTTNWATNMASGRIAGLTCIGRGGTGGTQNANATTLGYWNLTAVNQTLAQITSANYRYEYNTDFTRVQALRSAANASGNGDNGSTITLTFDYSMAGHISAADLSNFNDNINVAFGVTFSIVEPEVTYLTKSWTNPTFA